MSMLALIVITGFVCPSARAAYPEFQFSYACYESLNVWVDLTLDDNVAGYADFTKKEMVWGVPQVPQVAKEFAKQLFEIAESSITRCHNALGRAKKADHGSPLQQESPDIFIYTRYEGEEGVFNTLFCLANHFYPPSINFTWTINNVEVPDGIQKFRYHHNEDGTFHVISSLSFTPREGDFYSCKVQHEALKQPHSVTWELREKPRNPSAVFFTSSLVLSLVAIATGVFFFLKRPKYFLTNET